VKRIVNAGLLAAGVWLGPAAAVAQEDEHHAPGGGFESTRFAVQGFSDVTFRSEHVDADDGSPSQNTSTFALGQFSLFLSAQIAPNITVVSETAFVVGTDGRQPTSVTLERVYVKYVLTDAFKVAVGRTHTALGYWNEAYHHGALLHPTVSRPEILRFGGVMPVHSVGVEVSGRVPVGGWEFSYVGNLGNGRARDFSATQGAVDVNTGKATALKLSLAHETDRIVMFGPMIYRDVVPSDPSRPERQAELRETIAGAHFVYRDVHFELFSEYFDIRHDNRTTDTDADHKGWYATAVVRSWRWKPYVGVDVTEFAADDPYFLGGDVSVRRYLGGVRFDVNPFNALKFEVRREHRSSGDTHALVINTAFAF
jgi:hypothetical protein